MTNKKKYKIAFVSWQLSSVGLQEQLLREGHTLEVFVPNTFKRIDKDESGLSVLFPKRFTLVGKQRNNQKEEHLIFQEWIENGNFDFVVFDYNGIVMRKLADIAHRFHSFVIGPTQFTDKLEYDRTFGKEFAQHHGFVIRNKSQWCKDAEEVKALLASNPKKNFLLKGRFDTVYSYTAKDILSIVEKDALGFFRKERGVFVEEELLNVKELCFDTYFDGQHFLDEVIVNREYKGYFNDDRGRVLSGESGTAVIVTPRQELPKPIQKFMAKAEDNLARTNYRGFFGINTMTNVKKKQMHFLEFTPRFGYPTEHIVSVMTAPYYGHFLARLAGLHTDTIKFHPAACAIAFSAIEGLLPNPTKLQKLKPYVTGVNFRKKGLTPHDTTVLFDSIYDGKEIRVGIFDRAVVAVGVAQTVGAAREYAYNLAQNIKIWAHAYRDDIGDPKFLDDVEDIFEALG